MSPGGVSGVHKTVPENWQRQHKIQRCVTNVYMNTGKKQATPRFWKYRVTSTFAYHWKSQEDELIVLELDIVYQLSKLRKFGFMLQISLDHMQLPP